jgi:hypothetical protein
LGHHANEPILLVHDRQAPHLMLCHQLKRIRKIVIGPHRNELARRDLPSCPAYTRCERLRDLSGPPSRLWVFHDSLSKEGSDVVSP